MIFCWVLSLRLNVIGWGNWLCRVESLRLLHTKSSVSAFKKANRIEKAQEIESKTVREIESKSTREFESKTTTHVAQTWRGEIIRARAWEWGCEDGETN
jgi:hypothetical protein